MAQTADCVRTHPRLGTRKSWSRPVARRTGRRAGSGRLGNGDDEAAAVRSDDESDSIDGNRPLCWYWAGRRNCHRRGCEQHWPWGSAGAHLRCWDWRCRDERRRRIANNECRAPETVCVLRTGLGENLVIGLLVRALITRLVPQGIANRPGPSRAPSEASERSDQDRCAWPTVAGDDADAEPSTRRQQVGPSAHVPCPIPGGSAEPHGADRGADAVAFHPAAI